MSDSRRPRFDPLLAYETILEDAQLSVTVYDRDLVVCGVSRLAAEHAGLTRDEMLGRSLREYLPPAYVATTERVIAGETLEIEDQMPPELCPDELWTHVLMLPIRDAEGSVCGGVTIVVDVTEQTAQERALERTASLLEEAEKLAGLGSWEWDLSTDVAHYSLGWQRMHGLERADIPLSDGLPLCHPADAVTVLTAIERLRSDDRPLRFEHRIVRADGEVRHLEAFGRPVRGADGTIERVYGASLDVTERARAVRDLRERERRLQRVLAGVVSALAVSVEMRDPYTAGHQERVAELTLAMAQLLGWSDERIDGVHIAALLHDIGKLVIPAEILAKPSRLSSTEFEIIKRHSSAAAEILASVEFDEPVQAAILQHHERLDGSGYPEGLRGDEIIPEARVIATADVFEAMVSHRPYRPKLPQSAAIEELREGAGVRYDSEAVAACLQLVEGGFEFSSTRQ